MDKYFKTKRAVEIILDNVNEHFVKCLTYISIDQKYVYDIKLILGIVELLQAYINTRKNDILSSCIKYTNKSYYINFRDNLFSLIHNFLLNNTYHDKNTFINDLIYKYELSKSVPYIPNINETDDDNEEEQPIAKDAGTLFREAYFNRKVNKTSVKKDVEMQNIKLIGGNGVDNNDNDNDNDDLV
jgi:hypothetical protein